MSMVTITAAIAGAITARVRLYDETFAADVAVLRGAHGAAAVADALDLIERHGRPSKAP